MPLLLGSVPCASCLLFIASGRLSGCGIWMIGSSVGFLVLCLVLEVVVGLLRPGTPLFCTLRRFSGLNESHVHVFVADVVKSFDTVDRGVLDLVLGRLGLPVWFRGENFGCHDNVRFRFKLACVLGSPWTGDGGIPQGCPLSMVFIVALYLPWCRALESIPGVRPQLYASNLKCVSGSPAALLSAARFTNMYIRLVGQEAAPKKCAFLSTSKKVWNDMKGWVVSDTGDRWTVKLDVRDLGGDLDSTFTARATTLGYHIAAAVPRVPSVSVLPFDFCGKLRILRTMHIPAALHGAEASCLVGCAWPTMVLSLASWMGLLVQTLGLSFCLGVFGMDFFSDSLEEKSFPVVSEEVLMVLGICSGSVLIHLLSISQALSFMISWDWTGWLPALACSGGASLWSASVDDIAETRLERALGSYSDGVCRE